MIKSPRGQALMEALVSAVLLMTLVILIFGLFWMGYLKSRTEYEIHEALVCSVSEEIRMKNSDHRRNCERTLQSRINELPGHPKVTRVKWHQRPDQISLTISTSGWKFAKWKISSAQFTKCLKLPLENSWVMTTDFPHSFF